MSRLLYIVSEHSHIDFVFVVYDDNDDDDDDDHHHRHQRRRRHRHRRQQQQHHRNVSRGFEPRRWLPLFA